MHWVLLFSWSGWKASTCTMGRFSFSGGKCCAEKLSRRMWFWKRRGTKPKEGSLQMKRHIVIIVLLCWTDLSNNHCGVFTWQLLYGAIPCLGLPLGNQLCAAGLSAPPLPTPSPNSLASLSVFSWYSFLVEWPQTQAVYLLQLVEFSLADENSLGRGAVQKHEALLMATRAEKAQVESQICHRPEEHPLHKQNGLSLYRHLLPRKGRNWF